MGPASRRLCCEWRSSRTARRTVASSCGARWSPCRASRQRTGGGWPARRPRRHRRHRPERKHPPRCRPISLARRGPCPEASRAAPGRRRARPLPPRRRGNRCRRRGSRHAASRRGNPPARTGEYAASTNDAPNPERGRPAVEGAETRRLPRRPGPVQNAARSLYAGYAGSVAPSAAEAVVTRTMHGETPRYRVRHPR